MPHRAAVHRAHPHGFVDPGESTRHPHEVQDTDAAQFSSKLAAVFAECRRTLKNDGLLVFTYHHSRPEGWTSLLTAIYGAGFSVINAHPVKAEMSVATPKSQARSPIQLDIIFVCRKRESDLRSTVPACEALEQTTNGATAKLGRLAARGFQLSENDCRVTVFSQFIALLGPIASPGAAVQAFLAVPSQLDEVAQTLASTLPSDAEGQPTTAGLPRQLSLFT